MRNKKTVLDRAEIEKTARELGVSAEAIRKWFSVGRRIPRSWRVAIEAHTGGKIAGKF